MKALKTNFWLDLLIFGGFLVILEPRLTGIAVHEWLALAAAATLLVHILLHWDWIVNLTKHFLENPFHVSRLNYINGVLLFLGFTTVITSGLMISRSVLPALGLQIDAGRNWREIHNLSSDLTLWLVAVHFALHWSWIKNTASRLFAGLFRRRTAQPRPQSLPGSVTEAKVL